MTDEYVIVNYYDAHYSDGSPMRVSKRTLAMLTKANALLGWTASGPLTMEQGSYHDGALSGGTHSGDGVIDLSPYEWDKKCLALMKVGFMPFHRPYNWDHAGGGEHIHVVDPGTTRLSSAARAQTYDWAKHLDGLADHGPYTTGPWHHVGRYVYQEDTMTQTDIIDALQTWATSDAGKQAIAAAVLDSDSIPLLDGTYPPAYIAKNPTFTTKNVLAQLLKRVSGSAQ